MPPFTAGLSAFAAASPFAFGAGGQRQGQIQPAYRRPPSPKAQSGSARQAGTSGPQSVQQTGDPRQNLSGFQVPLQNFLQPLQNLIQNQQMMQFQNRAQGQQRAQFAQGVASRQNQQMGGFIDQAMGQMQQNFQTGAKTLQGMFNDPLTRKTQSLAMQQAENPGMDPNAIRQMKSQALQRNAANQGAALNNARWGLAGRGVSGASREHLMSMIRGRSGQEANSTLSGIDINAAQFEAQNRGQAINQLANLSGQRQNLGRAYAGFLGSFNPLQQLAQGQQLQQPFGQIGQSIGQLQ